MKKYVLIILSISLPLLSFAQRYDYDDIYFNPKKDIVKIVVDPSNKVDNAYSDELKYDNYQDTIPFDEEMSCTDRIQKFHRGGNSNSLDYMLSSDYTNVFILDEGQYHVSVYNDNVDIYQYGYYPYHPYKQDNESCLHSGQSEYFHQEGPPNKDKSYQYEVS